MKASPSRELFFREQTIANLRVLFGNNVDVVTCNIEGRVVALAYMVEAEGERIEVMQSSGLDVTYALRALHALSSNRVRAYFIDHNHQVTENELPKCRIVLPREQDSPIKAGQPTPPKYDVLSQHTAALKEAEASSGEHATEPNTPTTQCLESSHVEQKGYSVLVNIKCPNRPLIGCLRFIREPSRREILKVISQIMSEHGLSNMAFYMKAMSVKLNNYVYDILGYEHDRIESLLDYVVETEKLAKIECVYEIPPA
ncbi:uncharacterized protein KD926_004330 [Aspergillus affinis]|uniref:uncharacterized protein n=1 Tax=Aspergillus affinis TaxID=1070780 RepID=UPI0022FEAB98|nr:uncharacterized protein KD926_004330 [Aspergillus affinis]KAI9043147.1 hypothetical protein KD926_004330 [Aspergillus affinis]